MSNFRDKLHGFVIGTAVGILLGGGFFILKLDDYFKELQKIKSLASASDTLATKATDDNKAKKYSQKYKSQNSLNTTTFDEKTISTNTTNSQDSITSADSANTIAGSLQENIQVKKDELLATKNIEVINLNNNPKLDSKDSLIEKLSGIKEGKETTNYITAELWQSPINYKGYKLNKNKIIAFGMNDVELIKCYKYENAIYLKTTNALYKLDYNDDFKPFEKTTNELILVRIK